jgi:hypothetical protein
LQIVQRGREEVVVADELSWDTAGWVGAMLVNAGKFKSGCGNKQI